MPEKYSVGDTIVHKQMPWFKMTVEAIEDCETSSARPEPHQALRITDPDRQTDWICAYDVRRA